MGDRGPGMLAGSTERDRELAAIADEIAVLYHLEHRADTAGDGPSLEALHKRRMALEARRLRLLWDRRRVPRPRPDDRSWR